jgi:arsenate reductase (glutaredoxin)
LVYLACAVYFRHDFRHDALKSKNQRRIYISITDCEVKYLNIQIFGRKKCFDTRKAERYFKERKIKFQSIDIDRFGISRGELASVGAAVGVENLMDVDGGEYKRLNLKYIVHPEPVAELLFNNPKLIVTPIVRNGRQATIGFKPEIWEGWD